MFLNQNLLLYVLLTPLIGALSFSPTKQKKLFFFVKSSCHKFVPKVKCWFFSTNHKDINNLAIFNVIENYLNNPGLDGGNFWGYLFWCSLVSYILFRMISKDKYNLRLILISIGIHLQMCIFLILYDDFLKYRLLICSFCIVVQLLHLDAYDKKDKF